jgi:hypothetical protein
MKEINGTEYGKKYPLEHFQYENIFHDLCGKVEQA